MFESIDSHHVGSMRCKVGLQQKKDAVWNAAVALWAAHSRRLQWIETMQFFSRFGYLVAVFFLVSAFIAGAIGTAYHLSRESTSVLFFLFWGFACLLAARSLDRTKVKSSLVWLTMEHWGYLILILAILDTYANWASLSRDWTAVS